MAQTERKKVVGRVGVFKIDHSLISREMEQDYIPPDAVKEDEEFYTAVAETRDNFQVSDIGPGDVEHDAAISDEELDDELLEAAAEGVLHDISQFTSDEEIREEFEERQNIQAASKQMYREMRDYNAKSPELTAGDIDAAWEEANVGDETPGGLHPAPTPDQDVVDDIGRATGLTYEDDEPLRSVEKLRDRDVHRWELNPESADDDEELEDDEPHDPRPAKI
jgi:hypothetical protein